jgi:hypothetical protein
MIDQKLLEYVEYMLFYTMLDGCRLETHLGYKRHDPGRWSVSLRADHLSQLLDLAKDGIRSQA